MHERSNKEFNEIVQQLGWSVGRAASALESSADDIDAWQMGRRGVPERVLEILKKYRDIYQGRPASPRHDSGSTGRNTHRRGARHEEDPQQRDRATRYERAYRELLEAHYALLQKLPVEEQVSFGPFAVLGVLPGAPWEEIRSHYRSLSKSHHPDRGGDQDIMQRITQAYTELRLLYNR